MKDYQTTRKVNELMHEMIMSLDGFEGYSVISDSNQNPHTLVIMYFTQINLKTYEDVSSRFTQKFANVSSFLIPDAKNAHERLELVFHIEKESE